MSIVVCVCGTLCFHALRSALCALRSALCALRSLLSVLRLNRVWMRALRPAPRVKGQPLTIPLGRLRSQTLAMFVFSVYISGGVQFNHTFCALRSAFCALW